MKALAADKNFLAELDMARSAAHICRQMAKSIVKSGPCQRALDQLSYAFEVAKLPSLFIETYGTEQGELTADDVTKVVIMKDEARLLWPSCCTHLQVNGISPVSLKLPSCHCTSVRPVAYRWSVEFLAEGRWQGKTVYNEWVAGSEVIVGAKYM